MSQPVAVVTGASRGIGAASAKLLAEAGYAVCLNYHRSVAAANQVKHEIESRGGTCLVVQADVSLAEQVEHLFERVDRELGRLSVLVNNAAILRAQCRVEAISAQRFADTLSMNVLSVFLCCQEAIKRMSTKYGGSGGAIVNVSSMAARTGSPNEYVDYATSKGAVDTFTRGLALEVAGEGIRVNAVRPGLIYTDMHAAGGEPGRVDRLASRVPLQRGGEAIEVAQAILWLASAKSSFVTGSFVDTSGGL